MYRGSIASDHVDDIPSLLNDATLLLLTSDSEGMPNVVLEALGSGVPVVATAVGDLAQHSAAAMRSAGRPRHRASWSAAVLHVIAKARCIIDELSSPGSSDREPSLKTWSNRRTSY